MTMAVMIFARLANALGWSGARAYNSFPLKRSMTIAPLALSSLPMESCWAEEGGETCSNAESGPAWKGTLRGESDPKRRSDAMVRKIQRSLAHPPSAVHHAVVEPQIDVFRFLICGK